MRNEYYIWRACWWVYKHLDYHMCDSDKCSDFNRKLAAEGDPIFKARKKAVDARMARFMILAADKNYLDVWRCNKKKTSVTALTDEGLNLTNHFLLIPTGLISVLFKGNKVLITLLVTALITALSEFSVIGFAKSLIGKL